MPFYRNPRGEGYYEYSTWLYKGMKCRSGPHYYKTIREAKRSAVTTPFLVVLVILGPFWAYLLAEIIKKGPSVGLLIGLGMVGLLTYIIGIRLSGSDRRQLNELEREEKELKSSQSTQAQSVQPHAFLAKTQYNPAVRPIKRFSSTNNGQAGIKTVYCPLCRKQMVLRTNRRTGRKFWGCRGYPRCRYTRSL